MSRHGRAQEIITIALELAEREGIAGVTTARLARRMKFTEAALYRYFSGKAGILASGLDELARHLFATMAIDLLQPGAWQRETPAALLERHLKRFTHRNGLLVTLLIHAGETHDLLMRKVAMDFATEYLAKVESFLTGVLEGRPSPVPPVTLAQMWFCQLLGGFLRCRLSNADWDPLEQSGYKLFLQQLDSLRAIPVPKAVKG